MYNNSWKQEAPVLSIRRNDKMSNKNQLAILAKAGDEQALSELLPLMYETARFLASKLIQGRDADQDECVADAVSRTPEILKKWNPKKSKFSSFSEVCMRNFMINTLRVLRRHDWVPIETVAEYLVDPIDNTPLEMDDLSEMTKLSEVATSVLHTMSPSQKHMVLMILRGDRIDSIAQEYGISEKEAKGRLRSAIDYMLFEARLKHPELVDRLDSLRQQKDIR